MSGLSQPFDHSPNCFGICSEGGILSNRRFTQQIPRITPKNGTSSSLTPEDEKQHQELDALLSQAMNGLSFKERQQQQEILHGVDQVAEDDAFMDRALESLEHHLSSIKQGSAYEMAEMMDPDHVHDRAFRVMFLRANEYNPEASADQMLRFFDVKRKLFGEGKLTKDITIEDLNEGDIRSLNTGWLQLAGRDRSGRQVFIHIRSLMGNKLSKTVQNDFRVNFFMVMKALQSEETQVRGTVSIWLAMGDYKSASPPEGTSEAFLVARALPQKKSAIHLCTDEMFQFAISTTLIKLMKPEMRARSRLHFGSQVECLYQLSTFGILPQSWPFDAINGKMNLDCHLQWVRNQSTSLETATIIPGPNDVLFSGGKIAKHAGTLAFRQMIKDHSMVYDSGTDETKRQIAEVLAQRVYETGGRFLRQQQNSVTLWEVMPANEIRKKVMQTFRNRRHIARPKQSISDASGTLISDGPLPNDVIFGRVVGSQSSGTKLFHSLIEEHFDEYESLDRGVKMKLVESIMQIITDQGGRFLQPAKEQPGRWLELSYDSARERISKVFRNYRRRA